MVSEKLAAGNKRDVILSAALDLFVERGFHGTAMPSVAKLAQVGAGTIYRYFENKEALVNALYQSLKKSLGQQIMAKIDPTAPPRQQFSFYFRGMCRYLVEQPKAFSFLELHHHASYLDAESKAVETQLFDLASQMIKSAQEQGVVKKGSPVVLMAIIYGAVVGLARASWEKRVELTDENQTLAEESCWAAVSAST